MEEQKSSKKLITSQTKFSVALSFMVVAFALVSLVAFGFNQLSYAAQPAGDTFNAYIATNAGQEVAMNVIQPNGTPTTFTVPYYVGGAQAYGASNSIPVFCIEANAAFQGSGREYTKEEPVPDDGLLYILNQSKTLGGPGIVPTEFIDFIMQSGEGHNRAIVEDVVERYATQAAIWLYMNEKYGASNPSYSLAKGGKTAAENVEIIKNAGSINVSAFTSELAMPVDGLYDMAISKVVEDAKAGVTAKTLTLSREDSSISKVGDDGFYQTSKITVTGNPSTDLASFDVSVSGLDGAVVIDSKGAEKTHFEMAAGDGNEFYVRVPVDKVTDKASTVKVNVTGTFNNYLDAAVYTSDTFQRVVAVTGNQGRADDTLTIDFAYVPPTGMSKTQTIYFIGLIVLLCGVGIVYANAKPVKTEE